MPTDTTHLEMYQSIARKVREGNAVLFLGPGAVLAKDASGNWLPLSDLCARHLADKYGLQLTPDEECSLPYVTSTLRIQNRSTDSVLQDDVAKFYINLGNAIVLHPLLESLTDLRFRIVINTTPDAFVCRLYDEIARAYHFDFYNYYKPDSGLKFDFEKNPSVLIYNLFGHYQKPESLVLTYKHQLNYIKKIVSEQQNERLPDTLTNAFKDFRCHLFLGFDFEDWNLRLLLDTLYKNVRENIQPYSYPILSERKTASDTRVFFQGEFGMQFPPVDMTTFVENLVLQYNNLDSTTGAAPVNEAPKAQIFIWHNDAADHVGCDLFIKHLSTANVKIWTLRDATGQGDTADWMRSTLDQCQVVMPLLSADFFDAAGNPALALLEEVVKRNNPRKRFLVMPILLRPVSLEGALAQLESIRPLDRQPVLGGGKESDYATEITEGLKKYINRP